MPCLVVDGCKRPLPHYSTDGDGMLELIAKMLSLYWEIEIIYGFGGYVVTFFNSKTGKEVTACGEEVPETVGKAVYEALTGKEWRE